MGNRKTTVWERIEPGRPQPAGAAWERWSQVIGFWIPYATLAFSAILSLVLSGQSWPERGETVGLAALAAAWVFFMHTRAPSPRKKHRLRMAVYFAGLLALAAFLMSRHPIFFVFTITGFFHAADLKPWPLPVAGVGATSTLIHTVITGFPWPSLESWFIFGAIILVQTLAFGFGILISERVAELSEQRRQAVASLEAALEENAGLQAQLLAQARESGVIEERQRMAREIHDTLAQGFIGIITQLGAVQGKNIPADYRRHLDNAMHLARESLAEARRSVEALRPEHLESARLPDALAEVAQRWSAMNGVPVDITVTGDPAALHSEVEAALLRTAQEALANIAKHAHASRVGLTLSYMGAEVMLDIRDDGVGFAASDQNGGRSAGFGLTAMRQRVSRVAGVLSVESEPGSGTAVSARVPAIAAPEEAG